MSWKPPQIIDYVQDVLYAQHVHTFPNMLAYINITMNPIRSNMSRGQLAGTPCLQGHASAYMGPLGRGNSMDSQERALSPWGP